MKAYFKWVTLFGSLLIMLTTESCLQSQTLAESSFTIDGIERLEVKGGFCHVKLTGTSSSTVLFEGYIKGNGDPDKYNIQYRENDGVLELWVEYPNNVWGNIRSLLYFEVPEGTNIKVDNTSGNIETNGLAGESLFIKTTSGNIVLTETAANLEVQCTSGNVDINQLRGNNRIEATSGNIKCREIAGDARVQTSSGNIDIRDIKGDIAVACTSGNQKLLATYGLISARTTSGNIEGDRVQLTGNSDFRANSGNIKINLVNNEEALSFDLEAGSGNLFAAGSSGEDHLLIKRGEIMIQGITTSGNQRYVTGH